MHKQCLIKRRCLAFLNVNKSYLFPLMVIYVKFDEGGWEK